MSQSVTTRRIAAFAVKSVMKDGTALETALMSDPDYKGLDGRDRAFARLIAATTFRRLGQIDAALKPFIKQNPPAFIHAALRSAAAQILFLGTPAHAAVGETVNMLKARSTTRGFAKMANAILRRVVEQGPALAGAQPPSVNVPPWIRKQWEKRYGRLALRKMALRLSKDPVLDLSFKPGPDMKALFPDAVALDERTLRLPRIGDVAALPGFEEGQWWVQDIAASLPVKLLGDIKGLKVLDLCAAPGGKTLQLASMGAEVTAVDKSAARLERLRENLDRTGLEAEIICADILEYEPEKPFDIVLVDAPCSATGTFRRHPEVLLRANPSDLSKLVNLQRKILARSADWVRPGGRLVYIVCSLQIEEGAPQIEHFLQIMPDFRLIPLLTLPVLDLPGEAFADGMLRSMPHFLEEKGGMDGFFIALMQREI